MLADQVPMFDLRRQDTKNRQNSIDDIDPFTKQEFEIKIRRHFDEVVVLYQSMLDMNIAKECARFVLLWIHTNSHLYEWILPFLDSLYQSAFCSWNSERTHGHCKRM